jgi:hypothetical protein
VLCSWRYIEKRVKEFMICLLVMESAMIGVFCALDFVLFFVFEAGQPKEFQPGNGRVSSPTRLHSDFQECSRVKFSG